MGSAAPGAAVPRLHLLTDDEVLARPGFADRAVRLLAEGGPALALHVRGPATPGGPLYAAARTLVIPAGASGAWLVVNDRVDVALACGARGAHVGARSLPVAEARRLLRPPWCLGASVHEVAEAEEAAREGADWIFAGNTYGTASHPGRPGRGPGFVGEAARAAAGVPVLGIGGVTPERAGDLLAAGAWGVAVIRGIWDAADPLGALRRYLEWLGTQAHERGKEP